MPGLLILLAEPCGYSSTDLLGGWPRRCSCCADGRSGYLSGGSYAITADRLSSWGLAERLSCVRQGSWALYNHDSGGAGEAGYPLGASPASLPSRPLLAAPPPGAGGRRILGGPTALQTSQTVKLIAT